MLSQGIGQQGDIRETDTRVLWKKVNQAEKDGLPKTAIKYLKRIYDLTLDQNRQAEALKALVQRIVLESVIEGNRPEEKVNRLKAEIERVRPEMRPMMRVVQAQWIWHYFSRNRWRFLNRSRTVGLDEKDFTTWDLPKLFDEISSLFKAILKDENRLKKIPVDRYYDFLVKGSLPIGLRPTLYDFVAQEALRFYSSGEQVAARPEQAFDIRSDSLAPAPQFMARDIKTTNSDSPRYLALRLYQKLMLFHRDDKTRDAFIDVDIHRLRYVRNVAVGETVADRYIKRLQEIISNYPDSRLSSLAAYYQAHELKKQGKLVKAVKVASRGHEKFSKSRGGQNCLALVSRIREKQFHLKTEKVVIPDQPYRFTVEYKNIRELNFRIVRDNLQDYLLGKNKKQFNRLPESILRQMLAEKPLAEWSVSLKPTEDYQSRKQLVEVPAMSQGFYRILASYKEDFNDTSNKIQSSPLWFSRVALVLRGRNRILEGYVLDAVSGTPDSGATIRIYRYDYESRAYHEQQLLHTDTRGYFREQKSGSETYYNRLVTVTSDRLGLYCDTGLSPGHSLHKKRNFKTVFFTDRSLYRPGQMISFKGICLELDPRTHNYRVIPNQRVGVSIRDVNNQEVALQILVSNNFGSFSGTFMAPRDRLTGRMTLVADSPRGVATIRVEAYKRPKFQVDLKLPDREFRLNDRVTVCGEARNYTGAPIDQARVSYRVVREVRFPNWWYYWYQGPHRAEAREIIHGTLKTDKSGKFCMTFRARPDLSLPRSSQPVFSFKLQAEVTDGAGETRGDETRLRLGYTAMEASMNCQGWQEQDRPVCITVNTVNLNGQRTGAAGTVEIFALKGPSQPVPSDLIGEVGIRETETVSQDQPGHFRDSPDWKKWPSGRRVFKQAFQTSESSGPACVVKAKLNPGVYRASLTSHDRYGNPVRAYLHFLVLQKDKKHFPVKLPFYFTAKQAVLPVGETFEALWGTGYEQGPVLIEIFKDNKWLKKSWTRPDRTQGLIRIPIDEKLRGGFTLVATLVKQNRQYQTTTRVYVPWYNKQLQLQWQTFRSTLEPGQKETWSLKIKGPGSETRAAEMVATLYDGSLDQYYPHFFQSFSNLFDVDSTSLRFQFSNRRVDFSNFINHLNARHSYSAATYVHFPREVIQSLLGYQYGSRHRYLGKQRDDPRSGKGLGQVLPMSAKVVNGVSEEKDAALKETKRNGDRGKGGKKIDLSKVPARKNLNETAFFYPHLKTAGDGSVIIEFKMPEALTEWRFIGFAHTIDMQYGSIEGRSITRKDLMVQPNPPRFLREGDDLEFTVKVTNMSDKPASGSLRLQFFNPQNETSLDDSLNNRDKDQIFSIPPKQSRTLRFRIDVPDGLDMVAFRAVGATEKYSDGEEGVLPVLSRRLLVRESIPLWISGQGEKRFEFRKLSLSSGSGTLVHKGLTVQMTSNPAWYAVQALPYLMEFPYECSEQVFNRLYANGLARHIAHSDPRIRRIFNSWKASGALKSNLEKNPDLKSVLLRESPWVRQAQNETQAKHRIGLLFDENRLDRELKRAYLKLKDMQMSDGSWPWFSGGPANRYITLYIVTGFGRLRHLGVDDIPLDLTGKAIRFLDNWILEIYNRIVARGHLKSNNLGSRIALYLYGRSYYLKKHSLSSKYRKAVDYFLQQAREYWLKLNHRQNQAQLALALNRFGDSVTARKIMHSIKERSRFSEELGRYWRETELSWWWFRAPIETQAVIIEAFDEIMGDNQAVEECKVWLLKQKQARDWKTTKATADAVYAVLLRGDDLLTSDLPVEVTLGGHKVEIEKPEAGTGYYEKIYQPPDIVADMGRITVYKKDKGIAWGGVHWQYLEDISKITPHTGNPLKLKKRLFVRRFTDKGPMIEPYKGSLGVGDLLVVRIELRTDRDMEYIHMKDHRGSGLEPVNVLSRYKFQDGLSYYESTLDTATHFFIDYLPKGTYVFEYSLRVVHRGGFQSGMAHIECMYAPEFNSHSQSIQLQVK